MTTNFIKIAVVTTCLLQAINIQAQDADYIPLSGDFDFIAVKDISFRTAQVFEFGQVKNWEAEKPLLKWI